MRTLDEQIAAMASHWPQLALVARTGRVAVREGPVAPFRKDHTVRISYRPPLLVELFTAAAVQPRVQVLHPMLEPHPEFEEGPIPHVYPNKEDPDHPFLCLFDPRAGGWSINDLVADTTVPWTARWLAFYEGWLATGKWRGGGSHPTSVPEGAADAVAGKRIAPI